MTWEPEIEELVSIIPKNRRRAYNPRKMLAHVVDRGSLFEIAPLYGPSLVTALARLDGYPVAVLANDPAHAGGALTAAGSEKMTRFVNIEEIIDPRDTRPLLVDWVSLAYDNEATRLGVKTRGMRP